MPHAVIQRTPPPGRNPRHRHLHDIDQPPRRSRGQRGDPLEPPRRRAHLNATLSTASLILLTITSASSVPCLPLNPFIAATIPTISSETSRISPTYSTVPWPRSPARKRILRTRPSIAACT